MSAPKNGFGRRSRLSDSPDKLNELLLPIHRHWPDRSWSEDWCLYWLPLSFENKADTRADPRFKRFLDELLRRVVEETKAKEFTFFDCQLAFPHLLEHIPLHATEYVPFQAMGFVVGETPPAFPKYGDAEKIDPHAAYALLDKKRLQFRMQDLFPNIPRAYYDIFGDQEMARENFLGRGGCMVYLSQQSRNTFTESCKTILKQHSQDAVMMQLPLVVPVFTSESFLGGRAELLKKYFELFELYVGESPDDKGVLIASSRNRDELLVELVETCGYRAARTRK